MRAFIAIVIVFVAVQSAQAQNQDVINRKIVEQIRKLHERQTALEERVYKPSYPSTPTPTYSPPSYTPPATVDVSTPVYRRPVVVATPRPDGWEIAVDESRPARLRPKK